MGYEATDGELTGESKPSPAVTIEGVESPSDLDLISSDGSISIVGDDAADTIDFKFAGGGGPPAAHKDTHKSGGTDAFAAADVLESASRTLRTPLRNETGGSLPKGTLVAVTGFSIAEGRPTVAIADKDDSNARPAVAVTEASVGNNTNFEGLVLGILAGLDTSAFSVNDQLALGDAGAVSRPPPDTDPFTGEIQLVGSTVRIDASLGSIYFTLSSGLLPMTASHFFAARETSPTGGVTGGEVTRVSGLNVAVAAGSGFVNDGTDVFRVTWSAVPSLALTASDTNFIFVDKNGVVQKSVSLPDLGNNIALADAITDGTTVLLLANHQVLLTEPRAKSHDYAKDVIGNVVVSGVITTKDAIAFRLQVDTGTFYTRDFRVTVPATDPITFTYWFRDGSGGFTRVAGSTLIDKDNFDDGSGVLAALLTTEFKKDLLFVVFTATGAVEYHVFYGQEKFTSQSAAEAGNLPAADSDVIANGVRSGGVVIEGAAAAIDSVVDVRPFVAQLSPGTTTVSDHGLLGGLGDVDDHPGYAVLTGLRPMTGNQDLGGFAITNVGNVDGVDVSAHAARHTGGGADEIDGDQLDIDFTPANYAPDATPPEAADVDDLAAHLAGIDTMLELSKSITIENPTSAEDISMFFTNKSITITEIRAVLRGSATPSVTMTIRHGTDRNAAGAEVVTGGSVITSITTGSDITAFNDETIVADSFVWLETTAQSGTVDELQITIFYKKT